MGKRTKVTLVAEDSDISEDIDLDGFDDELIHYASSHSFLSADINPISSYKKYKKEDSTEFEGAKRKWAESVENDRGHLLVRDNNGKWTSPVVIDSESDLDPLRVEKVTVEKKKLPTSLKEWVAALSSLAKCVTENPEENYMKLNSLKDFYISKDSQKRLLSMASTVAIFRDILPGYPIRELSEAEKLVKVSKQVQSSREYEQTLLSAYTAFISYCKTEFSKKSDESCFKALCELIKTSSVHSFNHFESIFSVVASAAAGHYNIKIRISACRCLKNVFAEADDPSSRITMLGLKSIVSILRSKSFVVRDKELFEALKHVKLRSSESISITKNDHQSNSFIKGHSHMSKRERKLAKESNKEARKMAAVEAEAEKKQRFRWARECRDNLFGILFGFLKSKQNIHLLPICLSAVGCFAHFLGIEYFSDLTNLIKSLVKENLNKKDSNSLDLSLHCIVAVMKMSQIQDSSLDLKFFFDLYYYAMRHYSPAILAKHADPLQEAFSLLFLSNRILPKDRVGSFAHRIAYLLSLEEIEKSLYKLLVNQLCDLFTHYPAIKSLLDKDEFDMVNGTFIENCDDPDISRPFCKHLIIDPAVVAIIRKKSK